MHWRTCFICTQISYLATTMFKWTDVVGNLATCYPHSSLMQYIYILVWFLIVVKLIAKIVWKCSSVAAIEKVYPALARVKLLCFHQTDLMKHTMMLIISKLTYWPVLITIVNWKSSKGIILPCNILLDLLPLPWFPQWKWYIVSVKSYNGC